MSNIDERSDLRSVSVNPYAARSHVESSCAAGGVWRYGNMLVVQSGAVLPDRCIRCNAPAEGLRLRRQFYADAGALYLLLLLPTIFFRTAGNLP